MNWRLLALALALTGLAAAHDYWLKPAGRSVVLRYGHGSEDSAYKSEAVKKVLALNAKGQSVSVKAGLEDGRCRYEWQAEVAQLGTEIDGGFWCKTVTGWKNESKRQCANALLSEWSLYYAKVVLDPEASLHRSLGHPLEFLPLEISATSLRVRLLHAGKPAANVKIYQAHSKLAETDENGEATVARAGQLVLSCSLKQPLAGNPDADRLNLHAVLTI